MKEKEITSQESVAIINDMIERSKSRRMIGDGNLLLLWGYLTVGVALLVWGLLVLTHHPAMNWFWFLIWIVGGIATPSMARKRRDKTGVTTYADGIAGRVWSVVGYSTIALTFICLGFLLIGGKDAWCAMLILPLIIVGFAEVVQGVVIHESSLVCGGGVGLLVGLFIVGCIAAGVPLYASWFMPMFIATFSIMMILPGHVLNHKSRKER